MRIKNNIWYLFLTSFNKFLKNEKYPINETAYNCKIVDVVDGDLTNPNILTILDTPAYYFVKEDSTIYDENKNIVLILVQGDSFISNDITYFIASDGYYHEFRENKYNNTILGDLGISLKMGQFDVKKDETELTNEHRSNLPEIIIQMDQQSNVNALESKGTDSEKAFMFSIAIMCLEDDINNNITGYDEYYRIEDLMLELIYEYFESTQCALDTPFAGTNRGFEWFYDELIYNEYIRPVVVGTLFNTITYL